MITFLARRLALAVLTLAAISGVTFLLFFAVPASPAEVMCGRNCDARTIALTSERLGLDQPLWTQYRGFMTGLVAGRTYGQGELSRQCPAPCLGYSFKNDEPVTAVLARTVPVTVSIVIGGAVIWLSLGVGLGMLSAIRRGSWIDRASIGVSLTGASMQVYLFGLLLLLIFVYGLKWLPFPSYTPFLDSPLQWASGLLLPWVALGFLNSAIYARLTRAQMIETLSEDYIRTARAKGLPPRAVYGRHAFRGVLTPLITIAGIDIGAALGGTVITETVFGLQGLGKETVEAVSELNLPVVMATVLLAAGFLVLANILVDATYALIDPRVRLS